MRAWVVLYTAFLKTVELNSSEWGILLTGAEADLKHHQLQSAAQNCQPILCWNWGLETTHTHKLRHTHTTLYMSALTSLLRNVSVEWVVFWGVQLSSLVFRLTVIYLGNPVICFHCFFEARCWCFRWSTDFTPADWRCLTFKDKAGRQSIISVIGEGRVVMLCQVIINRLLRTFPSGTESPVFVPLAFLVHISRAKSSVMLGPSWGVLVKISQLLESKILQPLEPRRQPSWCEGIFLL